MKTFYLIILTLSLTFSLQAQDFRTIAVSVPGSLSTLLTPSESVALKDLTLTGTIDVRDFWTMRDHMPRLENVNMEDAVIEAYESLNDIHYNENEVPDGAFSKNFNDTVHPLKSIVLPSSTVVINHCAFNGCRNLTKIHIPISVKVIYCCTFWNCPGLRSIYCYGSTPPGYVRYGDGGFCIPFSAVDKEVSILYVPSGSKEIYASDYYWSVFQYIVEMPDYVLFTPIGAKEGSKATMDISSDFVWTATSNKSWLEVNPDSGTGNQTLTFTAHANTEDTIRIAIITVLSEDGIKQQLISVVQDALTTGLDDIAQNGTSLSCYPNPFTQQMILEITNPSNKEVTVEIYSISGLKIKTLARGLKGAKISLSWDGIDAQGRKVAPGVYLLKVNGGVRKVVKE